MKTYPDIAPMVGDVRSRFGARSYDAGYDFIAGVQLHSFGSYGVRQARAYENVRPPNRVVGSNNVDPMTGLFLSGTYDAAVASGNATLIRPPSGFRPGHRPTSAQASCCGRRRVRAVRHRRRLLS